MINDDLEKVSLLVWKISNKNTDTPKSYLLPSLEEKYPLPASTAPLSTAEPHYSQESWNFVSLTGKWTQNM